MHGDGIASRSSGKGQGHSPGQASRSQRTTIDGNPESSGFLLQDIFPDCHPGPLVRTGHRLFLFLDGWEALAPGDDRAGHTSLLNHRECMSVDVSNVSQNHYRMLDCLTKECDDRKGKYCYVGLNSSNSAKTVMRSLLGQGSFLYRCIGRSMKPKIDSKLAAVGARPVTLLNYSQLSLYYIQAALMSVLDDIDQGEVPILPQGVQTDKVTCNGCVRVGWLGLGVEQDLQHSMVLTPGNLAEYRKGKPFKVPASKSGNGPFLALQLGEDMQPSCTEPSCDPDAQSDVAHITFDLFRYCFCLTLAKFMHSASDTVSHSVYHDLYTGVRKHMHGNYVECRPAGLTVKVYQVMDKDNVEECKD